MAHIKQSFYLKSPQKLSLFLIKELKFTPSTAQKIVANRRVLVDGKIVTNPTEIVLGNIEISEFRANPIGLKPIFQTLDFAIFEKPPFMLSHPKNRNSLNSILDEAKYLFGGNIVHRLDFESSGLILTSKTKEIEIELKKLFQNREVKKEYLAYVKGVLRERVEIDAPISKNRDFKEVKDRGFIDFKFGKEAKTVITPLKQMGDTTLVKAKPLTGRVHQIRIHLNYIGFPILGEPIYGQSFEVASKYLDGKLSDRVKLTKAKRVMLHSNLLEFKLRGVNYRVISNSNFENLIEF